MASILNVDQINNAAGTSAITIDSNGNPHMAGHVVQTSSLTRVQNLQVTVTTTSFTALGNGVITSITPKFSNSMFRVVFNHQTSASSSSYLAVALYTSVNGGAYTNANSMLPSSWWGGTNHWASMSLDQIITPTYTLGDTISFQPYYRNYSSTTTYFGWGSSSPGSELQIYCQEIAQ